MENGVVIAKRIVLFPILIVKLICLLIDLPRDANVGKMTEAILL